MGVSFSKLLSNRIKYYWHTVTSSFGATVQWFLHTWCQNHTGGVTRKSRTFFSQINMPRLLIVMLFR